MSKEGLTDEHAVPVQPDNLLFSSTSEQQPQLSVILPTLNEEPGIEECITQIKSAIDAIGVSAEIIVSDSSTDRTPEIARELGATVIKPDKSGYGYAYRYAFKQARGDIIAIGDADATYDFTELPSLFETLEQQAADIVIGSRFAGEIKPGAMPKLHRYVGNPALTKFLNVFYGADVSDAHSGFRVFRRDVLEELTLTADGMEFASEMIMQASVNGMTIVEVPITYHERVGEATLNSFEDGWRHVRFMLLNAPKYLFSIPGLLMCGLGIVLMGLAFFGIEGDPGVGRSIEFGRRTMVAGSLLTIVGYQVMGNAVFTRVAGDPIQKQNGRVTNWIVNRLSLERGLLLGVLILTVGVSHALSLVYLWLTVGYTSLPPLTHDILAFTAIVIGVQTIFGSFMMSISANN